MHMLIRSWISRTIISLMLVVFAVALASASAQAAAGASSSANTLATAPGVSSQSTSALPGGGREYTYHFSNGKSLNDPIPASGYSPTTASAASLQEYAFPPRPASQATLAAWTTAMQDYRLTTTPTAAAASEFADSSPAPSGQYGVTVPLGASATAYGRSGNWGGYVANGGAAYTATYVSNEEAFVVPVISPDSCTNNSGQWAMGTIWGGLGGYNSDSLIQQGLTWCFGGNMSSSPGWEAFGEAIDYNSNPPGPLCGETLFIPTGDTAYMNMSYQQSSETAYFFVENENTGQAAHCAFPLGSSGYYDGSTSDWISEQPYNGSETCQWSLADYGSITMTDANTQLASNGALVSLGSQSNTLIDTGLDELPYYWSQYADGLSSNTSFLTNWYASRYTGDIAACGSPS